MLKNILIGLAALILVIIVVGILTPGERTLENEFLIKAPVHELADKLNDDLGMVQQMSIAGGSNIQTREQEQSRGKRDGRLQVEDPDMQSAAASLLVNMYKPVNYTVHTNFYMEHTEDGTVIYTFSNLRTSGLARFLSWMFNPAQRWNSILSETMDEIKADLESNFLALIKGYYIREENSIERVYVLIRQRVPFAKMNEFSLQEFARLDQFIQRQQLQRFPFSTFYYNINLEDEITDMAAAVRINRDIQVPDGKQIHYQRRGRVIHTRHYGHVDQSVNAHAAVRVYLEDNNMLYDFPFMETYEVGANTTDNPAEWVTHIEYFIVE